MKKEVRRDDRLETAKSWVKLWTKNRPQSKYVIERVKNGVNSLGFDNIEFITYQIKE